jgi:hypothetical protein
MDELFPDAGAAAHHAGRTELAVADLAAWLREREDATPWHDAVLTLALVEARAIDTVEGSRRMSRHAAATVGRVLLDVLTALRPEEAGNDDDDLARFVDAMRTEMGHAAHD